MLIKTLPVGMLATNCYIVTDKDTLKCAIIDPGAESNTILDYIESNNLKPEAVILTHGHFDHRLALDNVLKVFNIPVYLHEKEIDRSGKDTQLKMERDKNMKYCRDGDVINIGSISLKIMETPGHSPGSITIICNTPAGDYVSGEAYLGDEMRGALFTGDTLFCGDCGRTDLPGGNRDKILRSLRRIALLDGDYEVYPGHEESSTLSCERLTNMDMKIAAGEFK